LSMRNDTNDWKCFSKVKLGVKALELKKTNKTNPIHTPHKH